MYVCNDYDVIITFPSTRRDATHATARAHAQSMHARMRARPAGRPTQPKEKEQTTDGRETGEARAPLLFSLPRLWLASNYESYVVATVACLSHHISLSSLPVLP